MIRKRRPQIGVTTSAGKDYFMWQCTRLGVWLAGGRATRFSEHQTDGYELCDGYIISGGADIDPACYGQENTASVGVEPGRDVLEQAVIRHAFAQHKPLLGICRGAQMINVVRGGTLYQNVRDIHEGFVPTTSMLGKIFGRRKVNIIHEGKLSKLLGGRRSLMVNSIHHQAVHELGEGVIASATDELGIVQGTELTRPEAQFAVGVQWHPEFLLYRRAGRALFRALVALARLKPH